MKAPKQAVLLCGGLGIRLRPHTNHLPKPMAPCNGKPFLEYLLEQLAVLDVRKFLLLTGYLGEQIQEYFSDGEKWGWQITYSHGLVEWETGRRIWEAQPELDECFLLLYSDNFAPFPFSKVFSHHHSLGLPLTFMVSPKTPGNISIDEQGVVQCYDNQRSTALPYVEIGYMVVERDLVLQQFTKPDCSFSEVLRNMGTQHRIGAWIQNDAYHSISDPDRWKKAECYLIPKKIILLDRDGVINEKAPRGEYINRWEDFRWIERTRTALKQLAQGGFQFLVISNQAGIARGLTSASEVDRIHQEMTAALKQDGVSILQVYVCPHHWDEECECRKPKPGMLFQASKDYLLRLDQTCFVGDDPRDMKSADRAGCMGILFNENQDLVKEVLQRMHPVLPAEKLSYLDSKTKLEIHL